MKKKVIFGTVIGLIALTTLANIQWSSVNSNSEVKLKNLVAISKANAEDPVYGYYCPGSSSECVRIIVR